MTILPAVCVFALFPVYNYDKVLHNVAVNNIFQKNFIVCEFCDIITKKEGDFCEI